MKILCKFLFLFVIILITGSTSIFGQWSQNGDNIVYTNDSVAIGKSTPNALLELYEYSTKPATLRITNGQDVTGTSLYRIWDIENTGSLEFKTVYKIGDDNAITDTKLTIGQSGFVGIGIDNPRHKLEVDGTIKAEEVIIDDVAADFVFDKDYNLKSLQEVENYINENGHLPDIQPASVTSEGVKISEFNTILLQKIEELTLYIIQQQKEIEALKQSK